MTDHFCPCCESTVQQTPMTGTSTIQGIEVSGQEYYRCMACSEEWVDAAQARRNDDRCRAAGVRFWGDP